ncbi:MAG: SDR family NAD(P)-dependent oxidoreductase [Christensenellales bacterium]|jgi:3-oxoacyl-[acyl-carrier protein] reductase
MDLGIQGKTVIVTGGSKGIGSGISRAFALEGANVVVNYRSDPAQAEGFAAKLTAEGPGTAVAIQADVTVEGEVASLFSQAIQRFGSVDMLVNNAGLVDLRTVEIKDMTLEQYEHMVRNNTSSMFLCSREMVRHVLHRGYGGAHIINVLSKASVSSTSPGQMHYVTSKAGCMGFTKSLAAEVTKYGIHVNGIMPGFVRNQLHQKIEQENPEQWAKELEVIQRRSPIGRIAEPEDMGWMCVMLASDKTAFAVGACIDLTGGRLL